MASPDEFLYEYAVVRYVPRVDREEFINIGLIMMCKRCKWLRGEIRLDKSKLKVFKSFIDVENLERQASIFTRQDLPFADIPVEEKYRWLTAVKSAVLQVSPSHPGIITDTQNATLDTEFDRLFRSLVL